MKILKCFTVILAALVASSVLAAVPASASAASSGGVGGKAAHDRIVQNIVHEATGAPAEAVSRDHLTTTDLVAQADGRVVETLKQRTKDGFALMAVLNSRNQAQVNFDGLLDMAATAHLNRDGSITLRDGDEVVATIATPWARDATGRHLSTSYRLHRGRIVQTVDLSNATFPVVADPKVSFGARYGIPVGYQQYTWSEMWKIRNGLDAGQGIANLVCTVTGPAKVPCGIIVNLFASDIRNNVNSGISHKKCLKIGFPLYPAAVTMWVYDSYTVKCLS